MSDAALFEDEPPIEEQLATAEAEEAEGGEADDQSEAAEGEGAEGEGEKKAAEGEAEGDDKPEDDPDKPAQTVPVAVLRQERELRQQLQQELQGQSEKMARLDERLNHIKEATERARQEPEVPVEAPDEEEDPVGYLKFINEQQAQQLAKQGEEIEARIKPIEESAEQQKQQDDYEDAVDDLKDDIRDYETRYLGTAPDYHDAIGWMQAEAVKHYQILGVDPRQIRDLVEKDALSLGYTALVNGRDPADVAYQLAKSRGYPGPQADDGQSKKDAATEKLKRIDRGQKASSSLSKSGGEGPIPMTPETISEMSDEDFNKLSDRDWAKIMGA